MDPITIGTIVGLMLGAVALIFCFAKGKFGLGIVAALCTLVGGIALGIFGAAPLCGIFIWLARKGPDTAKQNS